MVRTPVQFPSYPPQPTQIASEEDTYKAQKSADLYLKGLSTDQVAHLRIKAKSDLFFLAYGILGYDRLSTNLHGDLCKWMVKTDGCQYREILLPRSHYKSTISTISDTIRIILPDDSGNSPYPRNLGTNVRVLVCHETNISASRFLVSITNHFLLNSVLLALFPECLPNRNKQRVNLNELEIPREAVWNEPTVDTMGVGAKKQGAHYNFIKPDDLYGVEARDSEAAHRGTIEWIDNLQAYLTTPKTDHIDFVGTRYKFDDAYAHIHRMYGPQLHKYIRSCEEIDESGKRYLIFPEEFTPESVEILKKNRKVWNSQYANNPAEGGTQFQEEWIRYYKWASQREILVTNLDKSIDRIAIDELDKCILIDPALVGLTGFIVTGSDSKGRVFILDAQKNNWKPPDLVNFLFSSVIKWNPRLVGIEEVLFSQLFQHWMSREMSARNLKFKIEALKTHQKSKESRVLGLSNYFSAGQIYFLEGQTELLQEFREFGASSNYHMLDALAYGPRVWRTPIAKGRIESYKSAEQMIWDSMDQETGYSVI